jgi:hypothetical protein
MMQTPKKRKFAEPRFISEIKTPDVSTPKRARRVLSLVRRIDEKKSKMIQTLQNKNRYLMKRIASLKELIKHLNNKGLMTEEAGNNLMVSMACGWWTLNFLKPLDLNVYIYIYIYN